MPLLLVGDAQARSHVRRVPTPGKMTKPPNPGNPGSGYLALNEPRFQPATGIPGMDMKRLALGTISREKKILQETGNAKSRASERQGQGHSP